MGTGLQIAAALDELAVRVENDHWFQKLSLLERPLIGCSLTVCHSDTSVIDHATDTVLVETVPAVLHGYAAGIREYAAR